MQKRGKKEEKPIKTCSKSRTSRTCNAKENAVSLPLIIRVSIRSLLCLRLKPNKTLTPESLLRISSKIPSNFPKPASNQSSRAL